MMHCTIGGAASHPERGRAWRARMASLVLACLCVLTLAACAGGSGSSGFDPVAAENAAIDRALDSQQCQVEGGITICASGSNPATPTPPPTRTATTTPTTPVPIEPTGTATVALTATVTFAVTGTPTPTGTPIVVPSGTPTTTGTIALRSPTATVTRTRTPPESSPTPTVTGSAPHDESPTPTPTATALPSNPGVDIEVGASDVVDCVQVDAAAPCVFALEFQPSGIPPGAVYRGAVRSRDPDSLWSIVPVVDDRIIIEVAPGVDLIQVAVLVYIGEPGFVPNEVDLLGDSGADYAFVTPVLTLAPMP